MTGQVLEGVFGVSRSTVTGILQLMEKNKKLPLYGIGCLVQKA